MREVRGFSVSVTYPWGGSRKPYICYLFVALAFNTMILAAIPAFDEEVGVGSLVLRTKQFVDWVIVIDDGSSDRTAEVAKLAGAEVVSHGENRGKGAALSS